MSAMTSNTGSGASVTGEDFDIIFLVVAGANFLTLNCDLAMEQNFRCDSVRTLRAARRSCNMQIIAQTDPISSDDTLTPRILILETDHGITAQGGNSAALQTELHARQICVFADDSFRDCGVPMSALND